MKRTRWLVGLPASRCGVGIVARAAPDDAPTRSDAGARAGRRRSDPSSGRRRRGADLAPHGDAAWRRAGAGQPGRMFANGTGVPRDDVRAYRWRTIAKASARPGSTPTPWPGGPRTAWQARMTAGQIACARARAAAWSHTRRHASH